MPRVVALELFELNLPLRRRFRHAAAERATSGSLFARCVTDTGHCGFGETLPRRYVTGEEQGATFDLLAQRILPRLLGLEFTSFRELVDFLVRCDGKAPAEWVQAQLPQTAAWCLVDLALLDTFARALKRDLHRELTGQSFVKGSWPERLRYSAVVSGDSSHRMLTTLLKVRLYGIEDVKLKVDGDCLSGVRLARRVLGRRARLRVDSNMAWSLQEAPSRMERLSLYGV